MQFQYRKRNLNINDMSKFHTLKHGEKPSETSAVLTTRAGRTEIKSSNPGFFERLKKKFCGNKGELILPPQQNQSE